MSGGELHCFVVPAYGRSPHLRDCLASLRAQTRQSPIVVTSSTPHEGLEALVSEFSGRLVLHSPNGGIGRDWNFALSQAGTRWATIAHQDDVYLPTFTARTLALIEQNPAATLVMTGYAELVGDRARARTPMLLIKRLLLELGFLGRTAIDGNSAKRRVLRFGCPIPCPSVTLCLDRANMRFREDLKVNLDWEAWLRLAGKEGAFVYARERLMLHRIHGTSETSEGIRAGVRAEEDRMMFEALWPLPVARVLARAYSMSYQSGAAA